MSQTLEITGKDIKFYMLKDKPAYMIKIREHEAGKKEALKELSDQIQHVKYEVKKLEEK